MRFACGDRAGWYEGQERTMRVAANGRAYERAAALKQQLERARTIDHTSFARVRPVSDFNYLIVQRGKGRSWAKPFFVRQGWITPGEPVRLNRIDDAAKSWVDRLHADSGGGDDAGDPDEDLQALTEQIWMVTHFLFKRDPPGLLLHASAVGQPEVLAELIRTRFTVKSKPAEGAKGSGSHAGP
jgi:excinuclease UvrABC nuclease subunit